jgi:hypothetical protein
MDLGQNQLSYFPAINLESLTGLSLADNVIETLGGFPENNSLSV